MAGSAARMLMFDLIARGYRVVAPTGRSDTEPGPGSVDAVARLSLSADHVARTNNFRRRREYRRFRLLSVSLSLRIEGVKTPALLLDTDTRVDQRVFRDVTRQEQFYFEPERGVLQRGIGALTQTLPACLEPDTQGVQVRMPVVFYADQGFIALRGDTWEQVLRSRFTYLNTIFRSQFHLSFELAGIRPWNHTGQALVESAVKSLRGRTMGKDDTIFVGILYNPWYGLAAGTGDAAGVAAHLQNQSVIREVPAPGQAPFWDAADHVLLLAHEIGHMLGAVHVDDARSIMYPSPDQFSYLFDSVNAEIINRTKTSFLRMKAAARVRNLMPIVSSIYTAKEHRASLLIREVEELCSHAVIDSAGTHAKIIDVEACIGDSAVIHALAGYRAFIKRDWIVSRTHFLAASALDPRYAEPYMYLCRIERRAGRDDQAETYRQAAEQLGKSVPLEY
jgi:hypothetical protein